ncbi:MAG: hypothetical protein E7168_01030 [Firmicutes bacterium]|nr:hypothetical protein [Bacillota bacterium]
MVESGLIIYKDGTVEYFGRHVCTDEETYIESSTHEESFIKEIVESLNFKFSNLQYNYDNSFYQNALELSLNGEMIIINNQLTTDSPTEILGYVPQEPTEEQLQSLLTDELQEKLNTMEIKRLYEFQSLDFDDYLEYETIEEYRNAKSIAKN